MPSSIKPGVLAAAALLGAAAAPPAALAQAAQAPGAAPRRAQPAPGAVPVAPPADLPAEPFEVPAGAATVLTKHLVASRPTVFVFTKPSSSLERKFLQQVCRDAGRKAGVGVLNLTTGAEPAARK
jgi:hypothetical protein